MATKDQSTTCWEDRRWRFVRFLATSYGPALADERVFLLGLRARGPQKNAYALPALMFALLVGPYFRNASSKLPPIIRDFDAQTGDCITEVLCRLRISMF